jgi:pterin-4a-carbinolamine dehydratase
LKNDQTIIAYHFGQYYCLLQKEWRLPKTEIDWLIKVLRNFKQNVCFITFDKFLTNVKLFHVYIKVHNTTSDIGHKPAISNIFNRFNNKVHNTTSDRGHKPAISNIFNKFKMCLICER